MEIGGRAKPSKKMLHENFGINLSSFIIRLAQGPRVAAEKQVFDNVNSITGVCFILQLPRRIPNAQAK
jgi:hypothetical protein